MRALRFIHSIILIKMREMSDDDPKSLEESLKVSKFHPDSLGIFKHLKASSNHC